MQKELRTKITIALFFLCFMIVWFVYVVTISVPEKTQYYDKTQELSETGFCVFSDVLNISEINAMKTACKKGEYQKVKDSVFSSRKIRNIITSLGDGYELQDYIWIIEKSSVHTCHRDNNGDFFNEGQQYPSYTMLVYLEEMDSCLSVLPTSHINPNMYWFNFTEPMHDILCSIGDAVLFNANLIHVGTFNKNPNRLRIQLKITHKTDRDKIAYYENFNKVLNRENNLPLALRQIQRSLSCTFPALSDLTQDENIRSSRGSDNGITIGILQKLFSYVFYGDSDYYDLPNAF